MSELWAKGTVRDVRKAFKSVYRLNERELDEAIVSSMSTHGKRLARETGIEESPWLVFVLHEYGTIGEPYGDIAPYTESYDQWNKAVQKVADTWSIEAVHWENWNAALSYVIITPLLIA